jgi:hypothetical protein
LPPKGWKSVTIPEHVYKYFEEDYEKNRKAYALKGVRSFSGYLTMKLSELMDQADRRPVK